jgi:hypothetical protein
MAGPINMDALFEANNPDLRGAARREARAKFNPYSKREVQKSLQMMVMGALQEVGGQRWLVKQADKYPVAFMGLIAKYLPFEARAGSGEPLHLIIETVPGGVVIREDAPGVINSPLRIVSRNVIEADEVPTSAAGG